MHVQINIGLLSFQLISHQPITLSIYLQINVNKYRKNSNITSQDAQGGLDFLGFGFIILVLNCYTSSSFSVKFLIRSLALQDNALRKHLYLDSTSEGGCLFDH